MSAAPSSSQRPEKLPTAARRHRASTMAGTSPAARKFGIPHPTFEPALGGRLDRGCGRREAPADDPFGDRKVPPRRRTRRAGGERPLRSTPWWRRSTSAAPPRTSARGPHKPRRGRRPREPRPNTTGAVRRRKPDRCGAAKHLGRVIAQPGDRKDPDPDHEKSAGLGREVERGRALEEDESGTRGRAPAAGSRSRSAGRSAQAAGRCRGESRRPAQRRPGQPIAGWPPTPPTPGRSSAKSVAFRAAQRGQNWRFRSPRECSARAVPRPNLPPLVQARRRRLSRVL